MSKNISDRMPGKLSDRMSECILDKRLEYMSVGKLEYGSDRRPEYMSDKVMSDTAECQLVGSLEDSFCLDVYLLTLSTYSSLVSTSQPTS